MMFAGGGAAMQALTGSIVREPILQGEPVSLKKLVRPGDGGYMSVLLQPGMRAVAMPVTVESGAGGFILPGDRVDVISSGKADQPGAQAGAGGVAQTVLTNVRVLAVDQKTEPEKNANTIVGGTVTLEVPASDVEVLVRAKAQGDLGLALRSYADMSGPAGRGAGFNGAVRIFRAGQVSQVSSP
jgi:pilus assembly protein CpaB